MKFEEALKAMKAGSKAKLPSWGGYWYWSPEKETIIMHTKDGQELDIRETQSVVYTLQNILSDEWIIADEVNCPQLGGEATFSFGEAIKYLKRGSKVARKGWNGKKQYIQLATGIYYKAADGEVVNCEHNAIGNMAEKAQYMQNKKEKELSDREAAVTRSELMAEAKNNLSDEGLPVELAEVLNYTDADACKKSMETVKKAFQTAVEKAVDEKLKGGKPPKKAPETNTQEALEKQVYNAMMGIF